MRTALCLYGQPRDAAGVAFRIDANVIKPNNCDVFFHAWYDPSDLSIKKMTPGHEHRQHIRQLDDIIISLYQPKTREIETPRKFHHKDFRASDENIEACWPWSKCYDRETFVKDRATCAHSMWYSVMKSLLLKDLYSQQEGFTYDAVILSRFDVAPTQAVRVSDYDLTKLWTRNCVYPRGEVSDWFMLGNNEVMNVVAGTYLNVERHYKTIQSTGNRIWTNEAFLREQLASFGVKNELGSFDVTF